MPEVPIGSIIPYVGPYDDPTQDALNSNGWWICDGNPKRKIKAPGTVWDKNDPPDLRYRFLVGYLSPGHPTGTPNTRVKARLMKPAGIATMATTFRNPGGSANLPPSLIVQAGQTWAIGGRVICTGSIQPNDVDI